MTLKGDDPALSTGSSPSTMGLRAKGDESPVLFRRVADASSVDQKSSLSAFGDVEVGLLIELKMPSNVVGEVAGGAADGGDGGGGTGLVVTEDSFLVFVLVEVVLVELSWAPHRHSEG